ncbi:MAG: hypothetical protein KC983_10185 [Phycisphaerales bacterium]|nr:hypothetical protein [Phycisphaerales bacterium]
MRHVNAKLVVIVIGFGAIGLALLANRQQRVNLTNEIKTIHEEYRHHEQTLWQLQTEIAVRISPQHIRDTIDATHDTYKPIPQKPLGMDEFDPAAIGDALTIEAFDPNAR